MISRGFCDAFLDDSHRSFREACERFAREEIFPHAQAWEEAGSFDRALYRKAAAAGLLGASYPEDYGGGGGDLFHEVVQTEALLRGGSTGVLVGLGSLGIALPPILALGDEEQKRRLIPPVLRGERVAALAVTEPGAGSDVAALTTRARRDGEAYVLEGTKLYVTSGVRADQLTVLARTGADPHGGLTFFVVEREHGYVVSRALKKTGWWASDTAEISFPEVRVPVRNRLGEEGSGFRCLMRTFVHERVFLAAIGVATAELALEESVAHARRRRAFGRPLAEHQALRHKLAAMSTQVLAAKAFAYHTTARVVRGEATPAEVAALKNFTAEAARAVCHEAVQLHGGMGYMRESLVERLSRDARLLSIGGGTTEIMNEIIAKAL
ncbi:MAG: acyl-CoA dehydrogenase [Planctomycetota bacterium]|nr:MAG: acyl-CoA dehydrogenase [Planctomycetota bacterium]